MSEIGVRISSTFSDRPTLLLPKIYFDLNLTSTFLSQLYFDLNFTSTLLSQLYFELNFTSTFSAKLYLDQNFTSTSLLRPKLSKYRGRSKRVEVEMSK